MTIFLFTYLFVPLASFCLLAVLRFSTKKYRQIRLAQSWRCGDVPFDICCDWLGVLSLWRMIQADRRKEFPDHFLQRFTRNTEHYGRPVTTIRVRVLGVDGIVTCDPENMRAMLATQFKEFGVGPNRYGTFSPLLGDGIFSTDGSKWEYAHRLLRPQFARSQVSDLELEEHHFQHLLQAIGSKSEGWTDVIDLQPLFFNLTMDTACEFLFGESLNVQLARMPNSKANIKHIHKDMDNDVFAEAFDEAQSWISFQLRFGNNYKLAQTKRFYEVNAIIHRYVDHFVQRALQYRKDNISAERPKKPKYTFLEALAEVEDDPIEIRANLVSLLLAGRNTTASLFGWFFVLLAQNPSYWDKLRAAIIEHFGEWDSCNPSAISFEKLKSCNFLQYCLNETLRLYPIITLNSRTALLRDTTLPNGGGPDGKRPIFIPKGTECQFITHATHRMPHLWGKDANAYRPERWEKRKMGWDYLPFAGGPRICMGQQFALTETAYVIVRLLQRFDKMDGTRIQGPMRQNVTIVNTPNDPISVRLHWAGH